MNKIHNYNQSSQLTSRQVARFYKLWFGILQYVNEQYKIVPPMLGKDFHKGIKINDADKLAKYIWTHRKLFTDYQDAGKLNRQEINILTSWQKYHLNGKFYIMRYLKTGAVFLSADNDGKPYLVKGLVSTFEEMWPKQVLPLLVETVLLPFETEITTSGIYFSSNILFGSNFKRDIKESCQQAELTYGLIASLPYSKELSKEDQIISRIKFYLQSNKNMQTYHNELNNLLSENPDRYLLVYHQYRGLLQAKNYKQEYQKLGIKKLYFALYGAVVIAAHTDKKQVEQTVRRLISEKEYDQIIFDHT